MNHIEIIFANFYSDTAGGVNLLTDIFTWPDLIAKEIGLPVTDEYGDYEEGEWIIDGWLTCIAKSAPKVLITNDLEDVVSFVEELRHVPCEFYVTAFKDMGYMMSHLSTTLKSKHPTP